MFMELRSRSSMKGGFFLFERLYMGRGGLVWREEILYTVYVSKHLDIRFYIGGTRALHLQKSL